MNLSISIRRSSIIPICAFTTCLSLCSCSQGPPPIIGNSSVQSGVASNTSLATVATTDPSVASAVKTSDVKTLSGDVGGNATIIGSISNIVYPTDNTANIVLWFNGGKKNAIGLIPPADFTKLPDMRNYVGKQIVMTGSVDMNKTAPTVTLSSSDQIKVVQ